MDATFKVVIFGDGGVGKTTLVNRYLTGVFKGDTTMTIGVDFHVKKMEMDGLSIGLQIWDFAGEEQFRFLLPSYVRGASGGIFMYDVTRYSSLKHMKDWMGVFNGECKDDRFQIPALMVGGKIDLETKRSISTEYGREIAEEHDFTDFVECSAKTGVNVEIVFEKLTHALLEQAQMIPTQ
mgnify:CR=1 FL=1